MTNQDKEQLLAKLHLNSVYPMRFMKYNKFYSDEVGKQITKTARKTIND